MMTLNTQRRSRLAGAILLALAAKGAMAIEIDYTLSVLGGSDYRYDYMLTNDGTLGAGVAVESFDIDFPTSSITSWTEIGANPGDWDEFSLLTLGDHLFGADALTGGIANGDGESFSVWFSWNVGGMPGNQLFTIYDPSSFDILESGLTRAASAPLPATLLLMGVGTIGLLFAGGASPGRRGWADPIFRPVRRGECPRHRESPVAHTGRHAVHQAAH